jgi:hypothetical protein
MAGKISWSPFNERNQNTPWPNFPSVKNNTQAFVTEKVERMCMLGVLKQQQAST